MIGQGQGIPPGLPKDKALAPGTDEFPPVLERVTNIARGKERRETVNRHPDGHRSLVDEDLGQIGLIGFDADLPGAHPLAQPKTGRQTVEDIQASENGNLQATERLKIFASLAD